MDTLLEKELGTKNYSFFMSVVYTYFKEIDTNRDEVIKNLGTSKITKNIDSYVKKFIEEELRGEVNYGKLFNTFSKIDPLMLAEDLIKEYKETKNEVIEDSQLKKEATSFGFLLLQVKSKIIDEISTQLNDTKFSDTIENQIKVAESLGFEKVFEDKRLKINTNLSNNDVEFFRKKIPDSERVEFVKDGKMNISYSEYFYIFYNKSDGSVLKIDTYDNSERNSADLLFGGFVKEGRDNMETFFSLGMGRSAEYTPKGHYYDCSLDVRDGFAAKYISAKSCFDFEKYKHDFSYYNLDTHIYRLNKERLDKEFVAENILKKLPQEVKESLLDYNICHMDLKDELFEFNYIEDELRDILGRDSKGMMFRDFLKENVAEFKEEMLLFYARESFDLRKNNELNRYEFAFEPLKELKNKFIENSGLNEDDYILLSGSLFRDRFGIFEKLNIKFDDVINKTVEEYKKCPLEDKLYLLNNDNFVHDVFIRRGLREKVDEIHLDLGLPPIQEIEKDNSIVKNLKESQNLKSKNKLN